MLLDHHIAACLARNEPTAFQSVRGAWTRAWNKSLCEVSPSSTALAKATCS